MIKHYPGGAMTDHIFNLKTGEELQFKGNHSLFLICLCSSVTHFLFLYNRSQIGPIPKFDYKPNQFEVRPSRFPLSSSLNSTKPLLPLVNRINRWWIRYHTNVASLAIDRCKPFRQDESNLNLFQPNRRRYSPTQRIRR